VTDGITSFAAKLGAGSPISTSLGYVGNSLTLNQIALETLYRDSSVIGAAIDIVADDMTRAGIEIKGGTDPDDIKKLTTAMSRLKIWDAIGEGLKWGRLYGGAVGVLMIDGQDLSKELKINTIGRNQFSGVRVYDRWWITPDMTRLVSDGVDRGSPEYYWVSYAYPERLGQSPTDGTHQIVHYSRVIRFEGLRLPMRARIENQLWGASVVERIYDRLTAYDSATEGAKELAFKAHLRTIAVDGLRDALKNPDLENVMAKFFGTIADLQTNTGLTILDSKDSFQTNSYGFGGLTDLIKHFAEQVAGACGIPLVRLLGQQNTGLGNSGDVVMRAYYDSISSQQASQLAQPIFKILQLLHMSVLGEPAPEDFDFVFAPLWQISSEEKADIAVKVSQSVKDLYDAGIISQEIALKELAQSSEQTGIFTNITAEDIDASKGMDLPTLGVAADVAI
jgi:phage-related protein (TIGR01555 family)